MKSMRSSELESQHILRASVAYCKTVAPRQVTVQVLFTYERVVCEWNQELHSDFIGLGYGSPLGYGLPLPFFHPIAVGSPYNLFIIFILFVPISSLLLCH